MAPESESESESEALRLRSLAVTKLRSSAFKSALKYARRARRLLPSLPSIDLMVTALKILRCPSDDHYKILRLDLFSSISQIKKQYKTLALILHPDKSQSLVPGAEEAFKKVSDSFRFLSDPHRKKSFDDRLKVRIAGERSEEMAADPSVETFWTACDTCRLLHQFDRRYLGHRLVCPSCHKSFLAIEVVEVREDDDDEEEEEEEVVRTRARVRVTGARSKTRSKPRVPMGWGTEEKMKLAPPEKKEKTLAEIQMEIARERAKNKNSAKKKNKDKHVVLVKEEEEEELSLMQVEDSDFYDFDADRTEKSFAKGQVWAVYDDDDGMPRHYGLVEEVRSVNPFRVKMCWLDVQVDGDEDLTLWEKSGRHISCGRFRVGRKVDIDSVNFFSHSVECERAAKEIYRIYPKKGSVWAAYGEKGSKGGEDDGRSYDIVVFLTSYSEMYGVSMAYLEKVEGFKTVFTRREIGLHAVKWLEKGNVRLFSHQIPARKLSSEEDKNLPKECWELDPASLPSDLLNVK